MSAILRKAQESAHVTMQFFEGHAADLEACAHALAARFKRGARLFAMGNGSSACDAQHIAVEFNHPIVGKRRALPATTLGSDLAFITALGNHGDFARVYVEQLELLARPDDAVVGISTSGASSNVNGAMRKAREMGLLTIGLIGRDGGLMASLADFPFVVPSWSIHRIQETHTLLLHLLWDHVHLAMGEDDVL